MSTRRKAKPVAKLSFEDAWHRLATEAAITAARGVVNPDGPVAPLTQVGWLSNTQWGWIVAAILFGWISTRAQQATSENLDVEQTIRTTAVQPQLLGRWSGNHDLARPCQSLPGPRLVTSARSLVKRDDDRVPAHRHAADSARTGRPRSLRDGITRKASTSTIARQANAAGGGPLLAPDEWDDLLGI